MVRHFRFDSVSDDLSASVYVVCVCVCLRDVFFKLDASDGLNFSFETSSESEGTVRRKGVLEGASKR